MENLNKENFWNAMKEQCPLAVEAFCKWIDEYKKEVGWDKLFNGGVHDAADTFWSATKAPKFHDIPFEMQMGILDRFAGEQIVDRFKKRDPDKVLEKKIDNICDIFIGLEKILLRNG